MIKNKEITVNNWDKKVQISVPENTILPVVPPPPILKEPEIEVKKALENPIGASPLFVR